MYSIFGKININSKNAIFGVLALILAVIVAYYLSFEEESKLDNFSDYLDFIFGKIYFIYIIIFMTFVFYNVLHYLFNNRESIKREISSRGQTLYNNTLGPNFINRSIQGGVNASNKLYNYSDRAYNYLRPNRAQINPQFTVKPLYIPEASKSYNPFD